MLFALDANVWLREKLLRSAVGVAFLHAVRRLDARILLPDSTRDEVVVGAERMGMKAVDRVQGSLLTVQALLGTRPKYKAPKPDDFRAGAEARLQELGEIIVPRKITLDLHERALRRVTEHVPPAETKEQYRDSLLWECVLVEEDEVILVSDDGDFSGKGGAAGVLAPALREEVGERCSLHTALKDALREVEPQLPPTSEATRDAITAAVTEVVSELPDKQGFRLGELLESEVELYATERADTTTAVFELQYRAHDLRTHDDSVMAEGIVRARGECLLRDEAVAELQMNRIDILTPDGDPLPGGVVYARGLSITRQVPYSVRSPVPW